MHGELERKAEEEIVVHLTILFMQHEGEIKQRKPQDSFKLFQPILKSRTSQIQMRCIAIVTIYHIFESCLLLEPL